MFVRIPSQVIGHASLRSASRREARAFPDAEQSEVCHGAGIRTVFRIPRSINCLWFNEEDRTCKIEDRRRKIEDRRRKIEDRRRNIEDRRRNIEDRRCNIEDRTCNIEDRTCNIEDRRRHE